jgi:hypothetical protein
MRSEKPSADNDDVDQGPQRELGGLRLMIQYARLEASAAGLPLAAYFLRLAGWVVAEAMGEPLKAD